MPTNIVRESACNSPRTSPRPNFFTNSGSCARTDLVYQGRRLPGESNETMAARLTEARVWLRLLFSNTSSDTVAISTTEA
ncbi:unnamed protein product, partial [Protopolystoma xenopodis]